MKPSRPSRPSRPSLPALVAAACVAAGCRGEARPARPADPPLFELLAPQATGVTFANELPEDTAFNILTYLYYYNGGGVAAGDIDNDGRPDLYFTSNVGSNRLYRNLGDYRFEDITDLAGVADSVGWKSGVTMADVNGDGWLDIYVSGVHDGPMHGRNVLYVNDRDGTFTDRTREFGLEYAGYSTQASFFDYDRDGDLDMYLLNHATHKDRSVGRREGQAVRNPRLGDRLYRNDGGRFMDVSAQAGIYGGVAFGLGVVASDFDDDGCTDLYVANDFQEDDLLYHNNCNGTFTETLARAMGHTSRFSMGADAADFDNDGRTDLVSVDMLPEREEIVKSSAHAESFALYERKLAAGYHPQFARNALQLNRGAGRFSDVAFLAGVAATDWSWAPLFVDLDNDGRKDLFITSGILHRPNDMDYIDYVSNAAVQASLARGITRENLSLVQRMPQVPIPSHAYRNLTQGPDLRFADVTQTWGLAQPGFSNGAAYVDLNNSGAMDLVVNRLGAPAAIYRNHARERNGNHYLQIRLRGRRGNKFGIGARVIIRHGDTRQVLEQMPTRGFQSAVDPRLHFGLGGDDRVDSLTVVWPDQHYQVLTNVPADRVITLAQDSAAGIYRRSPAPRPLFTDVTRQLGLDYRHVENPFVDFEREPLMPHLLSTEGPALAVGDVNGDGLDDFYAGGARGQRGRLFLQTTNGRFANRDDGALRADSVSEDVDAAFFDADGDGDLDLYVVSGGNELDGQDEALQDRLYLNDGTGRFTRARDALPRFAESGSHVAVGDFDRDGRPDLFVGRRAVNRRYGEPPRSYLLRSDRAGHFGDVTEQRAPGLARAGMVTSAAWLDYDGDGRLDLVVVGEWMSPRVFHQENGRFAERTEAVGLAAASGWWNTVASADLNGDGRPDLVLGNLGLNSYIRASNDRPARLYVSDFAKSGSLQQILTFYKDDVSYPFAGRDELLRQIPALRARFPSYASFGASRVADLFAPADLSQARTLDARTLASAVAINQADGTFTLRPLPDYAQVAPIFAALARDFDGDGRPDLLVGGNFYGVTPLEGRYDASYGQLLRGDGGGGFRPVDLPASGVLLEGQVRRIAPLRTVAGRQLILIARNDAGLQVLRPSSPPSAERGAQ